MSCPNRVEAWQTFTKPGSQSNWSSGWPGHHLCHGFAFLSSSCEAEAVVGDNVEMRSRTGIPHARSRRHLRYSSSLIMLGISHFATPDTNPHTNLAFLKQLPLQIVSPSTWRWKIMYLCPSTQFLNILIAKYLKCSSICSQRSTTVKVLFAVNLRARCSKPNH